MIVIDASALAAYVLREEGFEEILSYLRRYCAISVELALKEVANAILIALRRGRIEVEYAEKALRALLLMMGT